MSEIEEKEQNLTSNLVKSPTYVRQCKMFKNT